MVERVRGFLFVDYVRMVRSQKGVDWSQHLEPEDLAIILTNVDPEAWYPMGTFERLGVAILKEVARGQLDGVRMWGRFQVDSVTKRFPTLIAPGDPHETLMRFGVLAASFFDPVAFEVEAVDDNHASVTVRYGMSKVAEETASYQSLGFFERLVEAAGGKAVDARFTSRSWAGDASTELDLHWDR